MNYIACELCGSRWPMKRQAVLYSFQHDKMLCHKCMSKSDPAGGASHPPVVAAPAAVPQPAGSLPDDAEAALVAADDGMDAALAEGQAPAEDLWTYITGGNTDTPDDGIPF